MIPSKKTFLMLAIFALISCVDPLDFDQINDYKATPVISASLLFFEVLPANFFDSTKTTPIPEITDFTDFKIFTNDYFEEKAVKFEINIEVKNEFDSACSIQLLFLDSNGNITYLTSALKINAKKMDFTHLETIETSVNPNFVNTRRIQINIKIEQGVIPLDPEGLEKLELKSFGTLYLDSDA